MGQRVVCYFSGHSTIIVDRVCATPADGNDKHALGVDAHDRRASEHDSHGTQHMLFTNRMWEMLFVTRVCATRVPAGTGGLENAVENASVRCM